MTHDVFISYSSKDKTTADAVCAALEARGIRCWIAPRDVMPGRDWGAEIVNAISSSKIMVLIFSSHTNKSPHAQNELVTAISEEIAIIPFRIENVVPNASLKLHLARCHWLDALTPPLKKHLEKLSETVKLLLTAGEKKPGEEEEKEEAYERKEEEKRKTSPLISRLIKGASIVLGALIVIGAVFWLRHRAVSLERVEKMVDRGSYGEAIQILQKIKNKASLRDRALYGIGYCYIREGETEKAGQAFSRIPSDSPEEKALRKEGDIYWAYAAGDYDEVEELGRDLKDLNVVYSFSHTILGNVLLERGKLDQALHEYEEALRKPAIFSSQKSFAYAGLARVLREKGNSREALDYYHKASDLNPEDPGILTGLGLAYAGTGGVSEAISSLEKVSRKDPGNEIAQYVLKDLQARKQLIESGRERINLLINDLIRQKKTAAKRADEDSWTSRPLALVVMDFQKTGGNFPSEGIYEAYRQALSSALQDSGRVSVVDRSLLEEVLNELKLGASDLASPEAALKLGKILPAGFMVAGNFLWIDGGIQANIRLINTETTRLESVVSEEITAGKISGDAEKLAKIIILEIRGKRPLQGKIVSAEEANLILNIGSEEGMTPGLVMEVIEDKPLRVEGRIIDHREKEIGKLKIDSVQAHLSIATVIESSEEIRPGKKVREIEVISEKF